MALTDFCYRCPGCGHDPMRGDGDAASCGSCGMRIERRRGRLLMSSGEDDIQRGIGADGLYREVDRLGGPMTRATRADGTVTYSARALIAWRIREEAVWYRGILRGFAESMGPAVPGSITVNRDEIRVDDGGSGSGSWRHLDIGAVQAASSSLQLTLPGDRLVEFRLLDDSPRRWETLMRRLISDAWARAGRGRVVEFQPRIVTGREFADEPVRATQGEPRRPGSTGARMPEGLGPRAAGVERPSMGWYPLFRLAARVMTFGLVRLEVAGRRHIPRRGPFLLVVNHLSILDPVIVMASCPRPLETLTKSTQFASGKFFPWALPRAGAIPARRYKVDPQAVRTVLRVLERGGGVCIYPEGERSWNGTLQPLRRGTVRLLLKTGVPVVPCGISGSFEARPRWSRTLYRTRVSLRFGEPILLGVHDTRVERDRAHDSAARRISSALRRLSGERPPGEEDPERTVDSPPGRSEGGEDARHTGAPPAGGPVSGS